MKMIDDKEIDEILCPHCHVFVNIENLISDNDKIISLKKCPYCGGTVVCFK